MEEVRLQTSYSLGSSLSLVDFDLQGAPRFYASEAVQELALRLLTRKMKLDRELANLEGANPQLPTTAQPFLSAKVRHLETFVEAIALDRAARQLDDGPEDLPLLCYLTALSQPLQPQKDLPLAKLAEEMGEKLDGIAEVLVAQADTLNRHTFLLEVTETSRVSFRRLEKQNLLILALLRDKCKDWKTPSKSSRRQAEPAGPVRRRRETMAEDWTCQDLHPETYAFCVGGLEAYESLPATPGTSKGT